MIWDCHAAEFPLYKFFRYYQSTLVGLKKTVSFPVLDCTENETQKRALGRKLGFEFCTTANGPETRDLRSGQTLVGTIN